ncbi:kinase-like domain-containing protein [Ilyonectria sp. MPI-CAGE-AT-0026]|nr:kinase-like domain-containing protein [Ilyonectria sp. MPI-CAGE-AT-0026]
MSGYSFQPWFPDGIKNFIAASGSKYVALIDNESVLKFPIVSPHDDAASYSAAIQNYWRQTRDVALKGLEVEKQILEAIGNHERVICLKGMHKDGLLLENMPNGSVETYLQLHPETSFDQRMKWALQAAEGITFIHSKNAIHCDITVGNLLLDDALNLKISDFEGMILSPNGTVQLDGGARTNSLSSMPRDDLDHCDQKTDIFALGTAIYVIITGHWPFPDLDLVEQEEEVQRRFKSREFPTTKASHGDNIIRKCWTGEYMSMIEVVGDLQRVVYS